MFAKASKVLKRKLVFKDLARRAAMTKAANSGLPLPETSKYFKVRPNTMMVYHQASRDTAHKVAGILSGHAPASKPAGPGLLDEDFLLESTSLSIPENNAEVVDCCSGIPCSRCSSCARTGSPHCTCGCSSRARTGSLHCTYGCSSRARTGSPHCTCGCSSRARTGSPHCTCGCSSRARTGSPHCTCGRFEDRKG